VEPTQRAPVWQGTGSSAPARRSQIGRPLLNRSATAILGVPVTVLLIVLGTPWLAVGVAAVIVVGLVEFYRMVERIGYRPVWEAGLGAGLLFAIAATWPSPWESLILPAVLAYAMLVQLGSANPDRGLGNTAVTLLGVLYVGYLFSYVIRLRALTLSPGHPAGPMPALLVVCVVWAADSAAYFIGLAAGRHKLLPRVSPNKSLEGAAAAIVAGIAAALIFGWAARLPMLMAGVVGVLCASASVCGDLWESAMKREVGVKDAGSVLPGHGGVLDRFDGLLFAAVTGYAVMLWWPKP
jgi:phosphatidate cytidylyltransferase